MAILKPGFLVLAPDGMGFGKILSIKGSEAEVSFFHSAAFQQRRKYSIRKLQRGILSKQTRVFIWHENRWQVGRVVNLNQNDDQSIDYIAKFPDKRTFEINESEVNVRCGQPISSPADVLACWAVETQYFHERRRKLLEKIIAFRSAAQGMTGLISSSIELVRHQVDLARRVLQDPVQRYLLADEVGMGKTVEAGIIIRQCMIDHPNAAVLVATPAHLASQWRRELRYRFRVDEFPGNVEVLPFEEVDGDTSVPDLLVIDEVHNIFGASVADSGDFITHLESIAIAAPRLLLLSATPVLGHEQTLLRMLHLLNPDVYRLDDLDAFRKRVEKSREYGTILLGIRDDALPFVLKTRAEDALRIFEGDEIVGKLAPKIINAANSNDRIAISRFCAPLRRHIAETYRVHQRLIRTRRTDTDGWEFIDRGPSVHEAEGPVLSHVSCKFEKDARLPYVMDLLEQWRQSAGWALKGTSKGTSQEMVHRYIQFFNAVAEDLERLEKLVASIIKTPRKNSLFPDEMEILKALLDELHQEASGHTRFELLPGILREVHNKLSAKYRNVPVKAVLFTSSTDTARKVHRVLSDALGRTKVLLLENLADKDEDECESEIFLEDPQAWLLVCDRRGEEGLNFHFSQMSIHFDLPFSPGRIEQRIGRLDRFGRKFSSIEHIVILPFQEKDGPWSCWFEFLATSFRIFNQPISDLQFQLDEMTLELATSLFRSGTSGLKDIVAPFRERLVEQRERLDEQYALDRIALEQDQDAALFDALEEAEEAEDELEEALNDFLVSGMQFTWEKLPGHVFSFDWARETLIPERPWKADFLESINTELTSRRKTAAKNREVSLVRPGSSIINAVERLLNWDDRGTAFATWRSHSEWPAEKGFWTGFRLFYIVEADLNFDGGLEANENPQSLWRRSQSLLPPWCTNIYIDSAFNEVKDPELLTILELPYKGSDGTRKYQDFSIAKDIKACNSLVDPAIFADWCAGASKRAEQLLRSSDVFRERMEAAVTGATKTVEAWNERLSSRRGMEIRTGREEAARELLREIQLNLLLLEAVKNPLARLDSMGFFVLAKHGPGVPID